LPAGGQQAKQLLRVVDAGGKAAEIVQRILAFGRVDEASYDALNAGCAVREAIDFIRTILPTSITLHVDIDSRDHGGTIRGNKTQLTQILMNMATNARDAIAANVGTVWISLSRLDAEDERPAVRIGAVQPGPYVVLTVRDTGSGMDEATMARIFEPFFTTKGVGKGTGLGLSITHGIITSHGGAMQVESKPGRGTKFSIYLPIEVDQPVLALAS
jgi:signal transduction histidine kinase